MKVRLINENFKSNYVDNLLRARGIEDVNLYYHPTKDCLQDPTALENITEGAALLYSIINIRGKILVVVDSDNDGFTSGAIIYNYIKDINADIEIDYLLHENKQHGLEDHIDKIIDGNIHYDLVILPDSSSNDYEYHERLKEIKIPVLVLDHHITDVSLSDNAIIINNQLSPNYKNKELTGAGVVYQFCRYFDRVYGYNFAEKYMDMAAWGVN